jgi:hypothetical protein
LNRLGLKTSKSGLFCPTADFLKKLVATLAQVMYIPRSVSLVGKMEG